MRTEEPPKSMDPKKNKTVLVLHTRLDEMLTEQAWERYFSQLPVETQAKVMRYRRWEDRQAAVFGRLLVAEGLKRFGFTANAVSRVWLDTYKRPVIDCGVDFNISHSGEYVVCALSEGARLGIDIEKRKPFCFMDLAECFSEREQEELIKSQNREAIFYDFWTMKESVLKADGRGLSVPMDQIIVKNGRVMLDGATWFVEKLDFGQDYTCHLATNTDSPSIEMQKVEFDGGAESLMIGRLPPREHINPGVRYDLT